MEIRNKKIISILTKGQNPVATSHCCNIVRENPTTKNIVLLLDNYYSTRYSTENMAWIYDTDFEFLNCDSVSRIIIGGDRSYDYLLRLIIADIPREKIFCCENEDDIADYIDLNADTTYIMFDMFNQHLRYSAEESVKKRLENL